MDRPAQQPDPQRLTTTYLRVPVTYDPGVTDDQTIAQSVDRALRTTDATGLRRIGHAAIEPGSDDVVLGI